MNKIFFKICQYIDDYLFEPSNNWPKDEFKKRSYSRWAANEILIRLVIEDLKPPAHIVGQNRSSASEILTDFILEMGDFSRNTDNDDLYTMFTIAKQTAIDINTYIEKEIKNNE